MGKPDIVTPVEAPASEPPAAEAPKVEVPEPAAPAAEAPKVETPAAELPAAEAPKVEAPAAEPPSAEAPKVETPAAEPPAAETPKVEAPAAEPPSAEAPKVETPAAELPSAEAPKVEAPAAAAPASAVGKAKEIPEDEEEEASAPLSIQEQLAELRQEVQKMRKEADARKKLEVSEEEKGKQAEDILSAVGTEYTLLKKGAFTLEYNFNYSYFSGDVIKNASVVEQRSNHNLTNLIYGEYGLRDNLTINAGIPLVYKYNRVGTDKAQDATDLGDVFLGVQMQPFKARADFPTTIFSAGVTFPSGSSPYEVPPNESQSTGLGFYSLNTGVSLSKTLDPIVAYGNLTYIYNFEAGGLNQNFLDGRNLNRVDPGSVFNMAFGFGYALSYKMSLNLSTQIAYNLGNEYHFSNAAIFKTGSYISSTFNIGTGWRVTPGQSVYLKLGIGMTQNDPDFNFTIRVPFDF